MWQPGRTRFGPSLRRVGAVLSMVVLLMTATAATASAAPRAIGGAAPLAWSCPVGNLCVYTGDDGTGRRCNWSNADPDWESGSVVCSWSATTPVRSIYNHGTNSSFLGVLLYGSANYDFNSLWGCEVQGGQVPFIGLNDEGVYLRSHQWTNSFPYCS